MSYDELKRKLTSKQRENAELTRKYQEVESRISDLDIESEELEKRVQRSIEDEKQASRKLYVQSQTKELQSKLQQVQSEKLSIRAQFEADMELCDEEVLYNELRKKEYIPEDLENSMNSLRSAIVEDMGERFYEQYLKQVDSISVNLTNKELGGVIRKLSEMESKVRKLSSTDNLEVVDKVSDVLDDMARGKVDSDAKGALKFAGVIGIVMLLVSKIVFPAYSIFLAVKVAMNVRKNTVFSQALIQYKVVNDNLTRIEELLRQKAHQKKLELEESLLNEFNSKSQELDEQEASLEKELESTSLLAMNSFEFDTKTFVKRFEPVKLDIASRKKSSHGELSRISEQKDLVMSEIKELDAQIRKEIDSVVAKYLNFTEVSKNKILDPEFFIDMKNGAPVFFKHPEESMFISYDDEDTVRDFIKLIAAQVRVRLSPESYIIQFWDIKKMGASFLSFYKDTQQIVKVVSAKSDIAETLEDLVEQLEKRMDVMLKSYKNIREYNTHMLELESVPESYYFLFILDPDRSLFEDEKLSQLLTLGSAVGIYPMIFCNREDLGEDYESLVKGVSMHYEIVNEDIKKRARQFMLDSLVKF